jgi:hypothetical protein
MKYGKVVNDGYIIAINSNGRGTVISRQEFKLIQNALKSIPELSENEEAHLKDGTLEWEIVKN